MGRKPPMYGYGYGILTQLGWSEGKGIGKNQHGISEYIRPSRKSNHYGLGFDLASDLFGNYWWGMQPKKSTKTKTDPENVSERVKNMKNIDPTYKNLHKYFVKGDSLPSTVKETSPVLNDVDTRRKDCKKEKKRKYQDMIHPVEDTDKKHSKSSKKQKIENVVLSETKDQKSKLCSGNISNSSSVEETENLSVKRKKQKKSKTFEKDSLPSDGSVAKLKKQKKLKTDEEDFSSMTTHNNGSKAKKLKKSKIDSANSLVLDATDEAKKRKKSKTDSEKSIINKQAENSFVHSNKRKRREMGLEECSDQAEGENSVVKSKKHKKLKICPEETPCDDKIDDSVTQPKKHKKSKKEKSMIVTEDLSRQIPLNSVATGKNPKKKLKKSKRIIYDDIPNGILNTESSQNETNESVCEDTTDDLPLKKSKKSKWKDMKKSLIGTVVQTVSSLATWKQPNKKSEANLDDSPLRPSKYETATEEPEVSEKNNSKKIAENTVENGCNTSEHSESMEENLEVKYNDDLAIQKNQAIEPVESTDSSMLKLQRALEIAYLMASEILEKNKPQCV